MSSQSLSVNNRWKSKWIISYLNHFNKKTLLVFLVILIGAWLRFYYIGAGLPEVVYVDAFKFVDNARHIVRTGFLEPQEFQYPGFYTYLLAVIYRVLGINSDYGFHLTARIVSALFGTGLIYLTYLSALRVCSYWGALLAALLVSISIASVSLSRLPVTDSILTFFMTTGLWILARQSIHLRHFIAVGFCLGLAVGTKFTGIYLALFILITAISCAFRSRNRVLPFQGFALSILTATIFFLLTTPWIVPKFSDYYNRFLIEFQIQKFGQIGRIQYGYFDYLISSTITWEQPWLSTSLLYNTGPIVLIFGLIACLIGISSRFGFVPFLYASFVIIYLLLISRPGHLKAFRFLMPILPSFFILVGWFIETVILNQKKLRQNTVSILVVLLLLSIPVYHSLQYVSMTRLKMTNHHAFDWMKRNVPSDSSVFVTPFFLNNLKNLKLKFMNFQNAGSRQYRIPNDVRFNTELEPIYSPSLFNILKSSGVEYIVTNSYFDDAFSDIHENREWFPKSIDAYAEFRKHLDRETEVVYSIKGYNAGQLGPDISIYKFK